MQVDRAACRGKLGIKTAALAAGFLLHLQRIWLRVQRLHVQRLHVQRSALHVQWTEAASAAMPDCTVQPARLHNAARPTARCSPSERTVQLCQLHLQLHLQSAELHLQLQLQAAETAIYSPPRLQLQAPTPANAAPHTCICSPPNGCVPAKTCDRPSYSTCTGRVQLGRSSEESQ